MWEPTLLPADGAIYERIAQALERDIRAGVLQAGHRLPTLKELAARLGVTPGTISRAYDLAHRRGLVEGEVGRGTFVLGPAEANAATPTPPSQTSLLATPVATSASAVAPQDLPGAWTDLSIVKPNLSLQESVLRAALAELAQSASLPDMLDYTRDGGLPLHRQAGADWMQRAGLQVKTEQVMLTAGAQHGLWVAVNALTRAGDLVVCESLCYPGVASVVQSLGRRLKGVAMDEEGLRVDALRRLCEEDKPTLVICIANCQNPTATVMSAQRRQQLAALAREFDLMLVDDDLYGFLVPGQAPPLASYAPERTVYLTSLSKSVLPTVRLGYLHAPPEWLARLAASVRTTVWMVSPLAAQLATHLIGNGQADLLREAQREEARVRQLMARELLGQFDYRALPTSFHIWLRLPPQWSSGDQFAAVARSHQIGVAAGDAFSMNRDGEGRGFVRITLMPPSREHLRFVLTKLAGLLETPDPQWL